MAVAQKLQGALQVRFIPYLLVIPILLFQALSLSGCVSTSPSLPDLYIVSFTRNDTSTPLSLRLGYLGICAGNKTTLRCQPTAGSSAASILPALFPDLSNVTSASTQSKAAATESAAHALVSAALTLQSRIFIPLLAGAGVVFVAGLLLLMLLKRKLAASGGMAAPTALRLATLGALCLSAALAFTACLATSEAAGALEFSAKLAAGGAPGASVARMAIKPGIALQVLQWLAFGFTLLFTVSVPWLLRGAGVRGGDGEKY